MNDQLRLLEALLFAAAEPLAEAELALRMGEDADIPALLRTLAETYAERGVNLVALAGGWTFRTAPDLASALKSERNVLRRLARRYVRQLPQMTAPPVRFDVVSVYLVPERELEFQHFEGSFGWGDNWRD